MLRVITGLVCRVPGEDQHPRTSGVAREGRKPLETPDMKMMWVGPKRGHGQTAKRCRLWVGLVLGCIVGTLLTFAIEVAEPPLPVKPSQPMVAPTPKPQSKLIAKSPPAAQAKDTNPKTEEGKTLFQPGKITSPKPTESVNLTGVMVRTFGALLLVLALFLGGVWVFRRSKLFSVFQKSGSNLNILESKSLGTRHSLHVISYGDQRFLIADSPAGTRFLTSLQELPVIDPGNTEDGVPKPYADFASRLRNMMNRNA